MDIKKLIREFEENTLKSAEYYDKFDYINGTKFLDKELENYVQIIASKEGKEEFEKLLNHTNKRIVFEVTCTLLNGGENEKALKNLKKLMNENDKIGKSAKGYYKRLMDEEISKEYWLRSLEEAKERIRKNNKEKLIGVNKEKVEENNEADLNEMVQYEIPLYPDRKKDPINNFMQENYKGEYINIKDENEDNQYINIDINIINQKDEEFYIVYTTGMSDFPMNVPKTFFGKYNKYKYGELITLIPKEWGNEFNSKKWQGLIKLLRELAIYPHLNNTWISSGHTLETDMSELNKKFVSVG